MQRFTEVAKNMKADIHPKYVEATVTCACGNVFKTRSIKPEIRLEICSACHPFFTGKQKLIDSAGMVDRFERRLGKTQAALEAKDKKKVRRPKHRTTLGKEENS
jgi:large subunit ribosomal protein L31